jgi:hypothetical protein
MTSTVTFNVTDIITGNHLQSVNFTPANGDVVELKNSPFTHEYADGTFCPVCEAAGYKGKVSSLVVNAAPVSVDVSLAELLDITHSSFANLYIDQPIYSANNVLTSCRVRVYGKAIDVGTSTGVVATYTMTATELAGIVLTYKTVKA